MKSLADVVGAAGLQDFAVIALVIFFTVFIVVTIRVILTHREQYEHIARLPLDDDTPSPRRGNLGARP